MADAKRTYLDHNATSPLRPQAREAMVRALDAVGNASSVHAEGRAARGVVEAAREAVAALLGARPRDVVFIGGGTEAAVTLLTPFVERDRDRRPLDRLLVGATEHACVLAGGRFPAEQVERIPVDAAGLADLAWLEARLAALSGAGERAMVAVQAANNETGAIQPVAAIAALVRAAGGVVVCDAVQAAGKIDVAVGDLGADFVFVSAHKIGGPQGAGAIVAASPNVRIARPMMTGGGQERGARAGTENTPAIAGFGAAAAAVLADGAAERARIGGLRDALERNIRAAAPQATIFASGSPRLPNTTLVALPGLSAETALIAFDLDGVALSSGSACSSGKVKRSHVLDAMGVDPALAAGAIRISLGWSSDDDDVIRFARVFEKHVTALCLRQERAA
jgi:cysteine desulfurase